MVSPAARLHGLLLLTAGFVERPDRLTGLRAALAGGRLAEVAAGIAEILDRNRVPLSGEDLDVLAGLAPDAREVARLRTAPAASMPPTRWMFGPALRDPALFGDRMPPALDLTGPDAWAAASADDADRAAIATVSALPGARALWRAWRIGPDEPEPSVRVFLLEADVPPDALPALAARTPAEVFTAGTTLPPYQRLARQSSTLLWTDQELPGVRTARLFDRVDPARGPVFDDAHPRIADRTALLSYLDAGAPLLLTAQLMADVTDPSPGAVVPMSYRTDGAWIWPDGVAYYLRVHGLAPDPELTAHIAARSFAPPVVDAAGFHRAYAELMRPRTAAPAWSL